jgi:hypothetical protein
MMIGSNFDEIVSQVDRLSMQDKLRLMERLTATIRHDIEVGEKIADFSDWHKSLQATYGILADDPIQRWPQGDYEERDAIE